MPPLEESEKEFQDHEPTLREMLEVHRNKALCSSCHSRLDPLGLGFENFNAMGMWREKERGQPIDAKGQLITGESFESVRQLKQILRDKYRDDFYRCLTEKLMTYAIGRGLTNNDIDSVDQIVDGLDQARRPIVGTFDRNYSIPRVSKAAEVWRSRFGRVEFVTSGIRFLMKPFLRNEGHMLQRDSAAQTFRQPSGFNRRLFLRGLALAWRCRRSNRSCRAWWAAETETGAALASATPVRRCAWRLCTFPTARSRRPGGRRTKGPISNSTTR